MNYYIFSSLITLSFEGDFLFARCHLGPNKDGTQNENADGTPKKGNVEYKGYVHEVFQNEVGIGFSSK